MKNMRVVIISGYFNPIHTGHLDYIKAASKLGDKLVVIVNNDEQVKLKGSVPFMDVYDRIRIVNAIKGVDRVVLSIDTEKSVTKTIDSIYNEYAVNYDFDSMIFANGGDVTPSNSREEYFCQSIRVDTAYNIGGKKSQSSSELLKSRTITPNDP